MKPLLICVKDCCSKGEHKLSPNEFDFCWNTRENIISSDCDCDYLITSVLKK